MIMNILFIGTTGIHHALIAAHLYLNQWHEQDYGDLKLWGDWDKEALGLPLFLDFDDRGNKVYVLGVGGEVLMAQKTIEQLDKLLNRGMQDLIIKPVFIKRERVLLFLHRLGRTKISNHLVQILITYLLEKEFFTIQKQVESFRDRVRFV
jgi:hypothetical protein